ncbi:acetate/propionate family kinase [Variovorax sp. J22G73]|uniref:acetate/propionate family kinase n=1 Tax=unclassified Variovorax TaxID=663243 RepID=UPI00257783DD|nr:MULTISPECIES: acetate/propionate family kinase [unclassified Variovorax]MDM0005627.1 acetate/propionate family kinase [Variovorax sp. J22R203]MDM0099654.1 acetate/propionate family kinase [Variovorax sp. J22G73]
MTDSLLTLNAGSSSIKVALFDAAHPGDDGALPSARWSGQADGLGAGLQARLRVHDAQGQSLLDEPLAGAQASHQGALAALLEWHAHEAASERIAAVGHRIVHGGTDFVAPVRIDGPLLDALAKLEPLAPLHQPHNLAGVRAAMKAFGGVPQVACFDTAFHAVQPEVNRRFALPRELHDAGVRRYGFHGLSYESIVAQFASLAPALADKRVIVAHLGNGASMCGMAHGRSVATTMTFSPLDGLTMGTRCGSIDAAVVLYLLRARGLSADAVEKLLFRESGLLGLSGVSSDMRALQASAEPAAAEAIAHFAEQVVQHMGLLAGALRGVDAIVFTGGIGENDAALRERVLEDCEWLGVNVDAAANSKHSTGGALRLTTAESPVSAWVLRTDEEAVIARHTSRVLHTG